MDNDRDMIECVAKWLGLSFMSDGYFLTSGCEKAIIDKLRAHQIDVSLSMNGWRYDVQPGVISCFLAKYRKPDTDTIGVVRFDDNCSTIANALTLAVHRAIKAGKIEVVSDG